MTTWPTLVAAALISLPLIALLIQVPRFLTWRRGLEARLEAESTVVQTALGPVEYAERGHGVPILMLHGTPGGYDQIMSLAVATGADEVGLRLIAPSRTGYLRTPLGSHRTPARQADLFAALLDQLGVGKVVVLGASGGGPSALQWAIRHPDRCAALILEEAATRSIKAGRIAMPAALVDFLIYLFRERAIARLRAKAPDDPNMDQVAAAVVDTLVPIGRRLVGNENDRVQFAVMEDWPLDQIRCPTLILHGADDKDVPLAQAQYAHARIKGSQLVVLPGADHAMVALHYKTLNALIANFARTHGPSGEAGARREGQAQAGVNSTTG